MPSTLNDLKRTLFSLIGERNKDSIVNEIANSVNDTKIKNQKRDLEIKQSKFLIEYNKMNNYIYFGNSGILDKVGYTFNQYMGFEIKEREQISNKYNLLSPNKLGDILTSKGYNYENTIKDKKIKDEIIGSGKYFQNELELKTYLKAYVDLANSIKNGYISLMKAGQNLRGTDSFQYVAGFLDNKELEDILIIGESQLSRIISDLKFSGINIKDNENIDFKFNEIINKNEAKEQIAKSLINENDYPIINNNQKSITTEALLNSFNNLKKMKVIPKDKEVEEDDKNSISKDKKMQLLQEEDIMDQLIKVNQKNILSIDELFNKSSSTEQDALQNAGNTISLNFETLSKGLEVLSNPKKLVDDGIKEHIPIFENLNKVTIKETKQTYEKIERDLDKSVSQFVEQALQQKNK